MGSGNGIFTCSSLLVGFTASDGCGNVVSRSATVSVEDTINPNFSFFPEDFTWACDADSSTDALGFAEANDVCSGELIVTLAEAEFDEPPNGDCPGDHIITRTFTTFDNCGNSITADQVITVVIARASGPCDPEGCECDGCCPPAAASDCLAVDCQAVACRATPVKLLFVVVKEQHLNLLPLNANLILNFLNVNQFTFMLTMTMIVFAMLIPPKLQNRELLSQTNQFMKAS